MSIESDAHLSYLFRWAFLLVARIMLVSIIGSLGLLAAFAAGGHPGTGLVAGVASWPVWVIVTIYGAGRPRVTSDPTLLDVPERSRVP